MTPALAVINELKRRRLDDIFYIGRSTSIEGDSTPSAESVVIPNLGIKFYPITAGRLQRRFTKYTIPSLLKAPIGVVSSLLILSQERPDVIISFGSYVALPVVISGRILGIPTITHEQTIKGGLANRIISKFAKKVALSWPKSFEYFPANKSILTGNPIRREILDLKKKRTLRPVIFIAGGNQGAHSINEIVLEIIEELVKKYEVIHQTGASLKFKDYEILTARAEQLTKRLKKRYHVSKWFNSEEVAKIYSKASLLVGRSGANTVSEVAALGIPALFIPLPWAGGNEQEENARMLESLGAALVMPQERLTPKRLLSAINSIVGRLEEYKKNARQARKLIQPNASRLLVDEAVKLVNEKRD